MRPAVQPAGFWAAFGDLEKLAAEDNGEFHSQRTGSEFAADLPLSRCEATGDAALLSPVWQAGKPNLLDNAAYCLYRLRLYQTLDDATLTLEWEGYDPPAGTCWIGLADWQAMCWRWQELPASNQLMLTELPVWANNQAQCYAAIMLLDAFPRQLDSIGFGDIEPPEPPAQYNLFAPYMGKTTYLTDMDNNVVHTWESEYRPAATVYLQSDGTLLHTATLPWRQILIPGGGGRIEQLDWDGTVLWSYDLSDENILMHHDIEPLPNGNILAITWFKRTADELISLGRDPATMSFSRLYIDAVLEIEPLAEGGQVVWEWHVTDHFIQDYDPEKPDYGNIGDHPERVNINFSGGGMDWTHINGIDYNAELDQIALSVHGFSELWIIDHSTTTEEAAGHEGGNCGRGGDLLYRWGNPQAYNGSGEGERWLYGQHDVHWIRNGSPGAGNLLLFNNRFNAPAGPDTPYSTVLELVPPLNEDGTYLRDSSIFGPAEPLWEYKHDPPQSMFSASMSGCQRLANGNTVICCADKGWFLEVTPAGEVVWDYVNEFNEGGGNSVFRVTRVSGDYSGLANLELPPE